MNNLYARQKIKFALGLGLCAAIIVTLFVTFHAKSPQASTLDATTDPCASTLPVVEILEQDKDAAEQDQDVATVQVKYTGDIRPGATQMQVEIALTGEATYGSTKDYTFTTGGAYSNPPDKLIVIFEKNEPKQKLVIIKPVDDTVVENNPDPETIKFRIIPEAAATATYSVGINKETVVNIYDNDVPTPTMRVQATDASASEQNKDPGTFTISSSKKVAQDTVVNFQVGGTATANSDYTALPTSVTIKKDTTNTTVTVSPIDDAVKDEGDETVILTLVAGTDYKISDASKTATVVITDNESKPIVSITPDKANLSKGETETFTVNRAGSTATALSVSLELGGTALIGEYTIYPTPSGNNVTVLIPMGVSSAPITVMATGINQVTKSALLTIMPTNSYSVGTPSAATITLPANQISWLSSPLSFLKHYIGVATARAQSASCGYVAIMRVAHQSWKYDKSYKLVPYFNAGSERGVAKVLVLTLCDDKGTEKTFTDGNGITQPAITPVIAANMGDGCTVFNLSGLFTTDYVDKSAPTYPYYFNTNLGGLFKAKIAAVRTGSKPATNVIGYRPTVQGRVMEKQTQKAMPNATVCLFYRKPTSSKPSCSEPGVSIKTTTDKNGHYIFENIVWGDYIKNVQSTNNKNVYLGISAKDSVKILHEFELQGDQGTGNTKNCLVDCKSLGDSIRDVALQFNGDDGKNFFPNRRLSCASFASWVLVLAKATPEVCAREPSTSKLVQLLKQAENAERIYNNTKQTTDVINSLKPGDIITYRGDSFRTGYVHTAIFAGNGTIIHSNLGDIRVQNMTSVYTNNKIDVFRFTGCAEEPLPKRYPSSR